MKKSLNLFTDDNPEIDEDVIVEKMGTEFVSRFKNLEQDISHIDTRMSHIQKFCTNLELQTSNLQQLIKSDNNPGKKGKYYEIMNNCIMLNSTYEQLYIRCMELKQKYRKEQDDLHSRLFKLSELEIPKAKLDKSDQILTPANLALMMQELTNSINKSDIKADNIKVSLKELEDNEDYRL